MPQEIEKINQRFINLEQRLKKVDEIHYALLGNAISQDGGLVRRIRVLEENQKKMEKELNDLGKKINGFSIGQRFLWGAIGGVLMAIVALVLQNALK